jgi:hypothetical protein
MSIVTDFVEFLEDVVVKIYTETNTNGIVSKTLTSTTTVKMIVQANENSQSSNSEQLDRKLQGKNESGEMLFMTDNEYNKASTIFTYNGLNYRIDQKDEIKVILPHFEYVGVVSKV